MVRKVSRKKKTRGRVNGEAKASQSDLELRFTEARPRLSPRRQQLIRSILDSPNETYFLSSRELGKRYNVDAATIVRTVQALGYESFSDFAMALRQHFVARITPYTVLKAITKENRSVTDNINLNLDRAVENLNVLRSDLDRSKIVNVAKLIHHSRNILVVGVDGAHWLAAYLAYDLSALRFKAEAPLGTTGNLQHKIAVMTAKDLLIAISFGQCLRETVEAVHQARAAGVPTFGITDADTTPIARYCDDHVVTVVANPSYFNSYVAPLALISALCAACVHVYPARSLTMLRPTDKEYLSGRRWYREPRANADRS